MADFGPKKESKKFEDAELLLKPGETVDADRYRQQMINLNHALIEKRPEWARRHGRVILIHDNASSHTAKSMKDTITALEWEVLPHPPYSSDLAPSDYHLFKSMAHGLADQHFAYFDELQNGSKLESPRKGRGYTICRIVGQNV